MPHDLGIHRYVLSVYCALEYNRVLGRFEGSAERSGEPNQGGRKVLKPMMALRQRASLEMIHRVLCLKIGRCVNVVEVWQSIDRGGAGSTESILVLRWISSSGE